MRKGKRKKKIKMLNLIQLILIITALVSLISIISWFSQNKHTEDILMEAKKNVTVVDNESTAVAETEVRGNGRYIVNFNKLKKENSDTVGWLKVNGTNIEYPVVKGNDNDFYLTHSYDKSSNSAGWVFADCNNYLDGTDKNIVIYGHNRKDESVFGSLKNVLDKSWCQDKTNRKIDFITEKGSYSYEVFSVYKIEKENYYITTNFETDEEFEEYINTVKKRSIYDFGVEVTPADSILTLSTCANDNNYRVVLQARKK